jgi:hypothetical protein
MRAFRSLAVLVCLALVGCTVLGDLVNPSLVTALGLDPLTINPSQGVVVVAFKNSTSLPATFFGFSLVDETNPQRGARNFSSVVAPNATGNEVVNCPVTLVGPGALSSTFALSNVGAAVSSATATTNVSYLGEPFRLGESFQCGDVLEISLVAMSGTSSDPNSAATQASYVIRTRRIPAGS